MLVTDAKTQKIEPDPFFFYDGRKFRRQYVNVIDKTLSGLWTVFVFCSLCVPCDPVSPSC